MSSDFSPLGCPTWPVLAPSFPMSLDPLLLPNAEIAASAASAMAVTADTTAAAVDTHFQRSVAASAATSTPESSVERKRRHNREKYLRDKTKPGFLDRRTEISRASYQRCQEIRRLQVHQSGLPPAATAAAAVAPSAMAAAVVSAPPTTPIPQSVAASDATLVDTHFQRTVAASAATPTPESLDECKKRLKRERYRTDKATKPGFVERLREMRRESYHRCRKKQKLQVHQLDLPSAAAAASAPSTASRVYPMSPLFPMPSSALTLSPHLSPFRSFAGHRQPDPFLLSDKDLFLLPPAASDTAVLATASAASSAPKTLAERREHNLKRNRERYQKRKETEPGFSERYNKRKRESFLKRKERGQELQVHHSDLRSAAAASDATLIDALQQELGLWKQLNHDTEQQLQHLKQQRLQRHLVQPQPPLQIHHPGPFFPAAAAAAAAVYAPATASFSSGFPAFYPSAPFCH